MSEPPPHAPTTPLAVHRLLPGGRGLARALARRAPAVTLDWDRRQRSRFDAVDGEGRTLAVVLPRGTTVRGGDVLVAEDGSLRRIVAADEPVMVVRTCPERGRSFDLLRAAYHLGNRHVALELQPDHLKLEPDPVLARMLRAMHLEVEETTAPFEPEGGAYAGGGASHGHGHGHEHEHEHGRDPHGHGHPHDRGHHDPTHREPEHRR